MKKIYKLQNNPLRVYFSRDEQPEDSFKSCSKLFGFQT